VGHRQSSSNCSRVQRAEIRTWQLSPCPRMLSSHLSFILSALFSAIPLSFAGSDMTSALGCLRCFISALICLQMPSESSLPVTLLGPGDMLPAVVPCLLDCFWQLPWQTLSSLPCVQAGEPHQEERAGAVHAAPQPSCGFGVREPPRVGTAREGLIAHGAVPSHGARRLPRVAPTAGH